MAYFVALLADKECTKVLEAVAKVDKSFKSSVSGPILAPVEFPPRHLLVRPADVRGSFATLMGYLAKWPPSVSNGLTSTLHILLFSDHISLNSQASVGLMYIYI